MLKQLIISAFLILIIFVLGIVYFFIQINTQVIEREQSFIIQKGQGVREISQNLKEQELIKNKFIFETYVFLKGIKGKFQVGEYKLKPKMNIVQIAKILTQGIGMQNERRITIIEGWTIKKIAEYLEKEGIVSKNDFLKAVKNIGKLGHSDIKEYEFLKELSNYKLPRPRFAKRGGQATSYKLLEGYLFPDTYRIYKDATAEDIIKKMLDNFDQKLTSEMRHEIKKQGKTIFETVIMASIIEREVPNYEDRIIVSGIFWKRLEVGMPLQADSTLNYFTGNKSRALSSEELKIDSFYNTYLYPDFPPTPISNPGLSAIKAAIYPQESPYWYFLSKKTGETVFSQTLEEHNQNKRKWL